jgi:hypothetical protein
MGIGESSNCSKVCGCGLGLKSGELHSWVKMRTLSQCEVHDERIYSRSPWYPYGKSWASAFYNRKLLKVSTPYDRPNHPRHGGYHRQVLQRYIRDGSLFNDNAAAKVGL